MGKSPAFQLYAADFYMDTVTWTAEQVGAYFRLLLYEWINGPLDPDPKKLASICGIRIEKNWQRQWDRIWIVVGSKFAQNRLTNCSHLAHQNPDFLSNKRLEMEREKQIKNSQIQRDNVNKRWKNKNTAVLPTNKIGNTLHSSTSIKEKIIYKKEKIEYVENRFKNIPAELIEKWKQVAPGIRIEEEIKKAELWVISNPEKKRSKWAPFLSKWMVRAQENFIKYGGTNGRNASSFGDKRASISDRQNAEDERLAALARKWEATQASQASTGNCTGGNSPPDDVPDFPVPG